MPDRKVPQRLWHEGGDLLERWTNGLLDHQPSESLTGALKHLDRMGQALGEMKDSPEQLRELVAQRRDQFAELQAEENFWVRALEGVKRWLKQGLELAGLGKTAPPKPGRPKGSAPGLVEADADVRRITKLWKSAFKISQPLMAHQSPSAVEIAARRHGVTPEQLENFRKNKPKRSKK